jgi:hypothetical protein
MLANAYDKVTTVGRNTLGIVDYGNVAEQEYERFTVRYPTTRLNLIDDGLGTNGVGFAPQIQIPWTPDSINADADLAWVLADIEKQK